jgi:hypothetical protein
MSITPTLSIIITSYNTAKLTNDCLQSIFADKGLSFDLKKPLPDHKIPTEILVIDNASKDNSISVLKKEKKIKLIINKKNLGFAKANNQGILASQGNFILLLNSDTLILHSAISQSLNWLASHPEASVCTAQLLNSDKSIQASGGFFPNLSNVFTWSLGLDDLPFINKIIPPLHPHTPQFYTHDRFYLHDHQQDWVTGAFMLFRKSALDLSGLFDENYFMYGEEVELSYRLKQKLPQTQTWYLIGPQIIHLGGASAKNRLDPILNEYRGILSFFKKHHPRHLSLVKILLKLNASFRTLYFLLGGRTQAFITYQKACQNI